MVSQVLFLNLISFPKNAARRAANESRAEVFFLKKKKSTSSFPQRSAIYFAFKFSLVAFHLLANNCTIEMYCILGADRLRKNSSLQSTNALQFLQI